MENVQSLHWQLSVLSKAIHYKNLSAAASHVGLSQPQLSRIVARLEEELGVILLDRTARRKSGWTAIAFKIADTYFASSRRLTQSLQQLTTDTGVSHLNIGTLEGLVPLATSFCQILFSEAQMQLIELNVHDLNELEEHFAKDEIDLMFTFREPSKQKLRFVKNLGFQSLKSAGEKNGPWACSQFEFAGQKRGASKESPILVSNSLQVRRQWIETRRGHGVLPSEVRPRKTSEDDLPVLLIGAGMFNSALWKRIEQFRL